MELLAVDSARLLTSSCSCSKCFVRLQEAAFLQEVRTTAEEERANQLRWYEVQYTFKCYIGVRVICISKSIMCTIIDMAPYMAMLITVFSGNSCSSRNSHPK